MGQQEYRKAKQINLCRFLSAFNFNELCSSEVPSTAQLICPWLTSLQGIAKYVNYSCVDCNVSNRLIIPFVRISLGLCCNSL